MDFIKFKGGQQKEYLLKIKEKSGLSWDKLAILINRSKGMILKYLKEKNFVPKNVFDKLNNIYNIDFYNYEVFQLKILKKK